VSPAGVIRRGIIATLLLAATSSVAPRDVAGATRYDPALRFQSLVTPHFVIHYHQGEEAQALRLSLVAEAVHADLVARMGHVPAGRTHVVLIDQDDNPNGWTTPVPYNLIELTAAPPTGAATIGNTSDWLRLVFTHEYAHVLHLDQSRGWARVARAIFGRTPLAFPNLTLPLWQVEGIATFEEGRGGEGRVGAGDFHAIVREAARTGRFEPLDRVNGGLAAWPSGEGWYAYGAFFHEYLSRRFGEETLAELSRRTAGRLPYLGAGAFKSVYGASLGSLWRDFAADEAGARDHPPRRALKIRRLTHHGYLVDGPRFDRDGTIVYSRRDAHGFPSLDRVGLADADPRQIATRYGGSSVAIGREALYFDQLEVRANVAHSGDVYRLDRTTGAVQRLTRGARLADVDLSRDGRWLAAVRVGGGGRSLVILDRAALDAGRVVDAAAFGDRADAVYASPRWSPDGRLLAAERRLHHGLSEIVVVDAETHAVRVVATSPSGRNVTPAWTPDGRALIFASDRAGVFDLYRVTNVAEGGAEAAIERLTTVPGGARTPDVSPDGGTVVFVGYTTDGHDLFTMPLSDVLPADPTPPRARWDGLRRGLAVALRAEAEAGSHASIAAAGVGTAEAESNAPTAATSRGTVAAGSSGTAQATSTPYRPWGTLWPRAWLPIVETADHETRVGAATSGIDALGYHAWAAAVTWSVARASEVEPVSPGARPDVSLAYTYDRWRPTLVTQYRDETTLLLVATERRPAAIRERSVDVGLALPFRRVRWSHVAVAFWRREHDRVTGPADQAAFDRGAVRLGWAANTARRYGYSISPEDGLAAGLSLELMGPALGAEGRAQLYRADVRAFLPGGPRHSVVALRATAASSRGDLPARRTLRLGGHAADASVLSFEEDASSLLRGFPADAFGGANVALVNTEYRLPVWFVERGAGTWPVFLRTLHVSGFFDAGRAWGDGSVNDGTRLSWGAEAGADLTAGFVLPITWVVGVGWGRDRSGAFPDNREVYVRIGRGF
jgi:WD40-like Beta Propeller Repeat/Omp85 superfamily domain